MEEQVFDRKKFITKYVVMLIFMSALSLGFMIYYASTKVIIVSAEEAEAQALDNAGEEDEESIGSKSFKLSFKSTSDDGTFIVPCPGECGLTVSVRPDKKTVTLTFEDVNTNYFVGNAPYGDFAGVSDISERLFDRTAVVEIGCEKSSYADIRPSSKGVSVRIYDVVPEETVVAIDAAYGGSYTGTIVGDLCEKDVNLAIALKVRELAKNKPYRVVLTRDCDITVATDERLDILKVCGVDYYVGIALDTNMEDQSDFGMSACYNGEYYRNGFENVDFADTILKSVCVKASNRAKALEAKGKENVILRVLEIPGMELRAGTITNADEADLLRSDEYIERIAQGIIDGLDATVK